MIFFFRLILLFTPIGSFGAIHHTQVISVKFFNLASNPFFAMQKCTYFLGPEIVHEAKQLSKDTMLQLRYT